MSSVRSDWRRFRPAQPEEEPVEPEPKATTTESETLLQTPEEPGVLAVALAPPTFALAGPAVPAVADSRVFIPFIDRNSSEVAPAPPVEPPHMIPTREPSVSESVAVVSPVIEALEGLPSAVVDLAPSEIVHEPEIEAPEALASTPPSALAVPPVPEVEVDPAPAAAADLGGDSVEEIEAAAISLDAEMGTAETVELSPEAPLVETAEVALTEPMAAVSADGPDPVVAETPLVEEQAEAVPVEAAAVDPEPAEETPASTAQDAVALESPFSPSAGGDAFEEAAPAPDLEVEGAPIDVAPAPAVPIELAAAGETAQPDTAETAAADPEPILAVDHDPIAIAPESFAAEVEAALPGPEEIPAAPAAASPAESEVAVEVVGSANIEPSPAAEDAIAVDAPSGSQPTVEALPGKSTAAVAGGRGATVEVPPTSRPASPSVGPAAPSSGPTRGKRQHKPNTSAHRTEHGAPCPVCGGAAWMTVSPTLERCPRCSVLRLDPGAEIVQPMETQDLVLLRRVEAYRRESRERVLAVMNASHVSTGDLAELSLTPEQLAEMRVDGLPHIFGSFGMCVLPFALEQSREPVELLRSVHDMLVPGGRLLVASFDPLSLRSLMFGARWSGLRLPGQVYSFRRQHVERMLREAGFEKPRVERVSGCLRAAKPAPDSGSKFEMLALWRTIQNWGAASMFDAAKA